MLTVLVLAFILVAVLVLSTSREGYKSPGGATSPPLSTSRLEACLSGAVDRRVPVRPGNLQQVPVAAAEARAAMDAAVTKINSRCGLDLYILALDGAVKRADAVGTTQVSADVHTFSRREGVSSTLCLTTQNISNSGGSVYLVAARPLTSPAGPDRSGVQAAPTDVFDATFSELDTFGGLL